MRLSFIDPCSVLQASLAIAGFILRVELPSIMTTLKAGHPELAISSLLYGPNTLSQVKWFHSHVICPLIYSS